MQNTHENTSRRHRVNSNGHARIFPGKEI